MRATKDREGWVYGEPPTQLDKKITQLADWIRSDLRPEYIEEEITRLILGGQMQQIRLLINWCDNSGTPHFDKVGLENILAELQDRLKEKS